MKYKLMMQALLLSVLGSCYVGAMADTFDARVSWARKVALGLPVSGVVSHTRAQVGGRVKQGEELLALEDTLFKAELNQALAAIARQKINLKAARRDLAQAQELYDRIVLSTVALEEAKEKVARVEADLRSARAQKSKALYRLSRSRIVAPFDAWVLARHIAAGQTVVSELEARTLIELAAVGEYLARFEATADDLKQIQLGQTVSVRAEGASVNGAIASISLEPVKGAAGHAPMYAVTVQFSFDDKLLRAGQTVSVETS
ncbi:MAG: hypothetical protein BMS9Abin36_0725 [Gammaproteobacteria bacterium]|nr:MAG: hypothetical protein BMS9Abin36_0725 [Gammaproteobacteria bacterium]